MISFENLSSLVRSFFALWAFMLCLTNIGSAVLASVKKRFHFTAFALLLFVPAYLMWQVIFDFSLLGSTEKTAKLTDVLCAFPWVYWFCAFTVLTLTAALLFTFNIRYDKTFITPGTIKLYLDKMPCGICCWRDNGRVLFSNVCMNELCVAITGNPLLNGNDFQNAVKKEIHTVDGKVWRFVSREISIDGESLSEMIASDITAEYAKTEALEKDKADLSRLNKELREYYLSIDESVQRREILQAKMNIHDEMNRLMLSTAAADKNDTDTLNNIFSLWEQNALLLCMETDKKTVQQQSAALESLSKALKITLQWREPLPDYLSEKQKELFFYTAQEAVVNAVKHASAKRMIISFEQKENALLCSFTNDGKLPLSDVRFEGGLANVSRLAKKDGSSLYTEVGENFTLVLKYQPIG